jgi:hypothetical protein
MKYKLKGKELLEDLVDTGKKGIYTAGFGLSFLGLQYINENVLKNPVSFPLPENINIFSHEFAFYAVSGICFWGTVIESISFAYDTVKIPLKAISGKYIKKGNKR